MKENSGRFRLENSFPFLEGDICSQLGMSVEGVLADKILSNQANLDEYPKVKEVLSLLKIFRRRNIDISITTEQ